MSDLYKHIDSWDGTRLYTYVVVFIVVLWFFSTKNININLLFGLIIAGFIINYMNQRTINANDTYKDNMNIKKEAIKPKLSDESNTQEDIVNFFFSIQDLYYYNPLQYEEVIKKVNIFFDLYKVCFVDNSQSSTNYALMEQSKRDALNALASIIYNLPEDKRVRNILNNATNVLDEILTNHLDHISYLTDNELYKKNYNVNTQIINYGSKPYNEYTDIFSNYSYELY